MRSSSMSIFGFGWKPHDFDGAVGLVDFALGLARRRGGEHDIGRADAVPDLAQDRFGNLLDLRRSVADRPC